ncbi:hypothetical protein BVZ80_01346B, partial [Haemophilus influenzae]
VRVKSPHSV